jgi:hypothetical protein
MGIAIILRVAGIVITGGIKALTELSMKSWKIDMLCISTTLV